MDTAHPTRSPVLLATDEPFESLAATTQQSGCIASWREGVDAVERWLASGNYVAVGWPRPEGRDQLSPCVRTLDVWLSGADSK